MTQDTRERSLGELLGELSTETTTLVRQEIELARLEVSQKISKATKDAAFLAAGGAVAYAGLLAIIAAIILGLRAAGLPLWGSSLLVGAVIAAVGGGFVMKGISDFRNEGVAPQNTIRSLKEDVQWAKERVK